jgi:hypothetical protein
MSDLETKILFEMDKDIHCSQVPFLVGKYYVEPIPTNTQEKLNQKIKFLLKFSSNLENVAGSHCKPEKESELFLSFLSIPLNSSMTIDATMTNNIKTNQETTFPFWEIPELPDLNSSIKALMSLDYEIAKQFIRASEAYNEALKLKKTNPTLSYFLFCIAIECLSNKIYKEESIRKNFVKFLLNYFPSNDQFETKDLESFYTTIYKFHRNGFTHGGRPVPNAVQVADNHKLPYIINFIDGKEVKTPGLEWFNEIVQSSLMTFLHKTEIKETNNDYFKDYSKELGIINLKIKSDSQKDFKAGHAIFASDLELG